MELNHLIDRLIKIRDDHNAGASKVRLIVELDDKGQWEGPITDLAIKIMYSNAFSVPGDVILISET